MSSKSCSMIITLLLIITSIATVIVHPAPLSIELDEYIYSPGDEVEIKGIGEPNSTIELIINSTEGTILNRTIDIDDNGSFNHSIKIELNATLGRHTVQASSEADGQTLEFMVMEPDCILLAELVELMEEAKEKAEDRLEELAEKGLDLEEVQELIEEGEEEELKALHLREEGECSEAISKLIDALNLYGRAFITAEEEADGEAWERAEEAIQLGDSIERALDYLEELNQTATEMEDDLNLTDVRLQLSEAKNLLLEAKELLERVALTEEVIQQAEDLKSEARAIMGEVTGLIKSGNRQRKRDKTSEFLTRAEDRLSSLKSLVIETLKDSQASPQGIEAVEAAFEKAESSLLEAKERLDEDDLSHAIGKLDDVFEDTDEAMESLEEIDEGLRNKVEAFNRISERLDELRGRVEDANDTIHTYDYTEIKGINLTEINSLLEEAGYNLGNASLLLAGEKEEEDLDEAEELIEEAEKILEKIEELIEDVEEKMEEIVEDKEEEIEDETEEEAQEEKDEKDKDKDKKDKDKEKEKEDKDIEIDKKQKDKKDKEEDEEDEEED